MIRLFSFFFLVSIFSLQAKEEMTQHHNLVNVLSVTPDILLDIRYATSNNFLGFPVYPKALCFLHRDTAQALKEAVAEFALNKVRVKIFDGYRPLSAQQLMWDKLPDDRYVANPAKSKGCHTRGTAIDLTLADLEGNSLEMPTEFDDFTEKAATDYASVSSEAARNRALLKEVMERHHFKNYKAEWWHYNLEGGRDDEKYPPLDVSFEELERETSLL